MGTWLADGVNETMLAYRILGLAAGLKALKRATAEVSKKFSVMLKVRDAATDNWRRPG